MRVRQVGIWWRPVFLLTLAFCAWAVTTTVSGRDIPRTLRSLSPGFSRVVWSKGGFRRSSQQSQEPCAHIGDSTNSVSARTYLASTVFEGKARSTSSAREPGGIYGVTFVVQKVHKDKNSSPLRPRMIVRLQFRAGKEPPGLCRQSYNFTRRPGDFIRTNIKRGGKYLVFVMGVGPHNFTVLGEPVFRSRKNLQAVRDVLCNNCIKPVNVTGLRDLKVKVGEKLRLVCRCRGNPQPAIAWYKDGVPINASKSCKIQFKKKRSSLLIPKVRMEDSGRYECRATSVTGLVVSSWATITVPLPDNTTALSPLEWKPCPIPQYCLNEGTCAYYETVGELVCTCAEGYKGRRCENKDVYNHSSMYRPMSYFCKLGISSSYYC